MSLLDQDTGDPDYGTKRTDQVVDSSPSIASVAAPVANPPPALPTPGQAMQFPTPGSKESQAIQKPFEDYLKQADKDRAEGRALLSHDARLAEEARQRTEYHEGEIIPWDIDAQQRRFATDPIGSFGSLGSLFGIMAAAFTKQPMTNALNASAAAMTALREGKDEEFKRAYTAWKDNNEMAYKRHSLLQQDYNNTITKGEKDMGLIKFGLEQNMQKYKDEVGLAYLKTYGYGPEFVEFMTKRNDAIEKAHKISADATLDTYRNEMVKDGFKRNEEIQDPYQRAAANMAVMSRFFNFGDIEKHPNSALAGQMILLHGPGGPDPWPQEKLNKEVRDLMHPNYGRGGSATAVDQIQRINDRANELVETGEEPDPAKAHRRAADEIIRADAAAKASGKPLTIGQQEGQLVAARQQELSAEDPSRSPIDTRAQALQENYDRKAKARAIERGNSEKDINDLAEGIIEGTLDPNLTGFYRQKAPVEAELRRRGFNLAKAKIEWASALRQVASVNSPQMERFVGLSQAVVNTINEVDDLSKKMNLSGIPALNKLELQAYAQTQGNSPNGQLTAKYLGAINTLKEEFANLAQGGYAPTESVWKLANTQINENYGVKQLGASLGEVRRLINFRVSAMPNLDTMGPTAPNRYRPDRPVSSTTAAGKEPDETKTVGDKTYYRYGQSWFDEKQKQ